MQRSQTLRNTRGITLIEILVVLSVIATLLGATLAIFRSIAKQWNGQVSRSRAIQMANLGVDRMAKEISQTVQYNAFDTPPTITNTFNPPSDTDAAGNFVPKWSGSNLAYNYDERIRFYLAGPDGSSAGNILWRTYSDKLNGNGHWTPDKTWSLLSPTSTHGRVENVTSLSFQAGSAANTVVISLTVSAKEGPKTYPYTVTRTVYLANHN